MKNPRNLFLTYTQRSDCNKKVLGFEEKNLIHEITEIKSFLHDTLIVKKIKSFFVTLKLVNYVLLIIPHVLS